MKCECCGKKIYYGDTYYDIEGKPICIDCILDYLDENCKGEEDGEEFYVVDDTAWEMDEIGSLLKAREEKHERPVEEPHLTNRFGEII